MDYKNPLILTLMDASSQRSTQNPNQFIINSKSPWKTFQSEISRAAQAASGFDYIAVGYGPQGPDEDNLRGLSIMTNEISKLGDKYKVPVISRYADKAYQLNLKYGDGKQYMPSNEEVLTKYYQFGNNDVWQYNQSQVWGRLAKINGLSDGRYGANHVKALTDPSRGLTKNDVKDFFTLRGNQPIVPALMNDDMIGMPGINAKQTTDNFYVGKKLVSHGAISLSTMGSGYVIPMKNKNGDMAKFQIGADVSAYNLTLKAKAADGVSIQNSEIYDKDSKLFKFTFTDGYPTMLQVKQANNDKVVFEDLLGQFAVPLKNDIKPFLVERGYDIPELIDTLKPQPKAKYNWPAPGNMVGVAEKGGLDVPKLVSPSCAGFIPVYPPATPEAGYTLLVVEGALKGHIVAKYLEHNNTNPISNQIAKDGNGLIVAQVPGVIRKFIESTRDIYDTFDIRDSVVAMDADGRYNRNVAKGIADAEEILAAQGPVRVMSWNPEQKGLDDALIAFSKREITLDDLGLTFGTANELFPLAQATPPNPYRLDGTRANKLDWQIEYDDDKQRSDAEKTVVMNTSRERDEQLRHGGVQDDVPQIYQVPDDALARISEKREQGELSDDDIRAFMQSISELTKDLQDRVSSFAQ